jgi:hypothetical protein
MSKTLNQHLKGFDQYLIVEGMYMPQAKMPTTKKIPAGIYRVGKTQDGKIVFMPMSAMTDGLIDLPAHVSEKVLTEVNKFWSQETKSKFEKYQMVYKRGVLLYGPPGTGKTVIVSKVMEQVVREGGLVFFDVDPHLLFESVNLIKEIQGDIKILAVYEEFDSRLNRDSSFLSLLDGELQIENITYLATTNYIERIPPRVKNRPSRFATVIEIGVPDAATRLAFLKGKVQDENIDFTEWVKATEGMSLDHIKDLIISVLCIGLDLKEAVAKLKTMNGELLSASSEDDDDERDDGLHGLSKYATVGSIDHLPLRDQLLLIRQELRRRGQ